MAGARRTPALAGTFVSAEPEIKFAPETTALETSASTRVLEAVFTMVGGKAEESAPVRVAFRTPVKAGVIEE
ncbi:hypothetical protein N7510_001299 [Penicillium lagena]|uniref:uncharacterized protein n=1 Tax=Penicillium lagena TaxID=94218 RepID=UPI00254018A0|nr:uncharacterized protein N7510_001299 [Penicillium lagena]KAJ5624990.1 hypothetical protein N7510_001299 [Penicillium lagena]